MRYLTAQRIDGEPRLKILIVKLSSLGDVVHAMPAVQDLACAFPQAEIDWVVERPFASVVRRCKGVRRVICCELRKWRQSPFSPETRQAFVLFKAELQRESYDAVIDLQGLTKSAWVSWLARLGSQGQRFAMANQTEGSSFEAPTRWVAHQAIALVPHSHAVTRSRLLCAKALRYPFTGDASFGLIAHADQAPDTMKNTAIKLGVKGVVALVHGTSREDKQWPLRHWRELALRLQDAGFAIALAHGSDAEAHQARCIAKEIKHVQVWPRLGLDALTDALDCCAGVIGVDSGPSHIAVALNLPHVQIYNFDTAWRTGPVPASQSRQCSVFDQPTPTVDAVWQAWLSVWASVALHP